MKHELILIMQRSTKNYGYGHVTFTVGTIDADSNTPRNILDYPHETKPAQYYNALNVSCQIDGREDPRDVMSYAWEVTMTPHIVDRHNAGHIAKTMTTIYRKLDKLTETLGQPSDYGQYVARVCQVLGIKTIACRQGDNQVSDYTAHKWAYISPGVAVGYINDEVRRIKHDLDLTDNT